MSGILDDREADMAGEGAGAAAQTRALTIHVPDSGDVDALLALPARARALYVLAHGAGAPMRHAFMSAIADALLARGVGTLRFNFPYTQAARRAPDRPPVLEATILAAIDTAHRAAPDVPLFAGGKSMGGRMTSQALARTPLDVVRGIVFLGFPLHGAGKPPDTKRAEHLSAVRVPMLFVQGTRDALADLTLLRGVIERLGTRPTLHIVDDADHGFHVRKKSGRDDAAVIGEIADAVSGWMASIGAAAATDAIER